MTLGSAIKAAKRNGNADVVARLEAIPDEPGALERWLEDPKNAARWAELEVVHAGGFSEEPSGA